jgi:hypothetical protein
VDFRPTTVMQPRLLVSVLVAASTVALDCGRRSDLTESAVGPGDASAPDVVPADAAVDQGLDQAACVDAS